MTSAQRGLSLIELILYIVIVGVGVAGILSVYTTTVKSSADPMLRKQAIAIAESLLEEIQSQPFTTCDPDDPNAALGSGCTLLEGIGPEAGEKRLNDATPADDALFDNVNDYHGLSLSGITSLDMQEGAAAIAGLEHYNAQVSVASQALGSVGAGDAVKITVTVTDPQGQSLSLDGYRTRHAPALF
jgi:MSHA pilin protein MshD